MKSIYTRGGDFGTTAIHGGMRVKKTDARIRANGNLDELNTTLGICRSLLALENRYAPVDFGALLKEIQLDLMKMMSRVATPSHMRKQVAANPAAHIEELIDAIAVAPEGGRYCFVVPGGSLAASFLHQARTTARRAERSLWELNEQDPVDEDILKYVNRLSDLFFVMATSISEERINKISF